MHKIYTIPELEQVIAWETGCTLIALSFSKKEDGWLMTIKVKDTKGRSKVSFTHANTVDICLELISTALVTTSINLKWRDDRYQ